MFQVVLVASKLAKSRQYAKLANSAHGCMKRSTASESKKGTAFPYLVVTGPHLGTASNFGCQQNTKDTNELEQVQQRP